MADARDQLLLSKLLRDLAGESHREDAAHLEERVLQRWSDPEAIDPHLAPVSASARVTRKMAAAGALAAMMICAVLLYRSGGYAGTGFRTGGGTTTERHADVSATTVDGPAPAYEPTPSTTGRLKPVPTRKPAPASGPVSTHEAVTLRFVPLGPMSPDEMTGTFQIVRVQMPRTSLGALAAAAAGPGDLIQADVLLGEDGMARAIRVASEDTYPWRNR
jgi:hypothetical protein